MDMGKLWKWSVRERRESTRNGVNVGSSSTRDQTWTKTQSSVYCVWTVFNQISALIGHQRPRRSQILEINHYEQPFTETVHWVLPVKLRDVGNFHSKAAFSLIVLEPNLSVAAITYFLIMQTLQRIHWNGQNTVFQFSLLASVYKQDCWYWIASSGKTPNTVLCKTYSGSAVRLVWTPYSCV